MTLAKLSYFFTAACIVVCLLAGFVVVEAIHAYQEEYKDKNQEAARLAERGDLLK